MSRVLQALAWISPSAAIERARALNLLEAARSYEAAQDGRRARSFPRAGGSANVAIGRSLATLRERSRALVRDTPIGARALDVVGANAIGTGIRVEWDTGSDPTDKRLRTAWEEWITSADVEGVLDFPGLQLVALRSMLEGGDVAIRFIDRRLDGSRRVPFALQVLEGDFIDESRDGKFDARDARLGVGLGEWSERLGLYLHREHPGDVARTLSANGSTFVPRARVAHLYRPLRAGQVRGVPIFAPILLTARDYADLMDAVVVKQRTEACIGLFVETAEAPARTLAARTESDGKGRRIEELAPGMVLYGQPGEKVTPFIPSGTTQIEPVSKATLRAIAVGVGLTYAQLSGDLSDANYSSLRTGSVEHRRLIEQLQWLSLVPMLLQRVTERWLDRAMLAGVIRSRTEPYARTYVMPAFEAIDPLKDMKADILAVRAGRMSPQEFIASWGRPWRQVVEQFREFYGQTGDLTFDIDPRRVAQNGRGFVNAAGDRDETDDEDDGDDA